MIENRTCFKTMTGTSPPWMLYTWPAWAPELAWSALQFHKNLLGVSSCLLVATCLRHWHARSWRIWTSKRGATFRLPRIRELLGIQTCCHTPSQARRWSSRCEPFWWQGDTAVRVSGKEKNKNRHLFVRQVARKFLALSMNWHFRAYWKSRRSSSDPPFSSLSSISSSSSAPALLQRSRWK